MIIIEGIDGVGKTTLAKNICCDLNYNYIKENKPLYEGFNYYCDRSLQLSFYDVVDRFHLGEFVYPNLKKDGRKPIKFWRQNIIERSLQTLQTIVILVDADDDFIENVYNTRGEDYVDSSEIGITRALFNKAFNKSILIKKKFNTCNDSYEELLNFIKENQNYQNLYKYEFLGNINSDIMLIGERYADNTFIGNNKKAFFADINSSLYLHKALYLSPENGNHYITNAFKTNLFNFNECAIKEEIKIVQPKIIIALGNKVSSFLKVLNISHKKIPHPQYWRRFKYKNIKEYSKLLN